MRLRHLLYPAAALAVGAGVTVFAVLPASAATIDTTAWYQLINRSTGKALDVYQASLADGGDVDQWAPNASAANQQWQFVSSGSGWYRLKARNSGKVADVNAGSTADGGDVIQWTDNNATNQQWSVTDTSGGYVKLLNRKSGKAVDVEGGSSADGANVIQWADNGGTNQQWQLVKADAGGGGGGTPPTVPGNLGTHDPSRVIADNGAYFFYSTGGGIPGWYTTDGSTWKQTPAIFPNGVPASVHNAAPANDGHDVWAPDVIWNPGTGLFNLYYSIANWDVTSQSAIGLATSPTLNPSASNYHWTDRGVVISQTSASAGYSAIDPAPFFDAAGNLWLTFGSGYVSQNRPHGISIIPLNKTTGLRSGTALYTQLSCGCEASYAQYHGGYYYLFWNTGGCCSGASSTYVVHVARSTSITGPYTERSAKFLSSTSTRHGPGHLGILSVGGKDYYSYHYYPNSGGSVLGFGTITWGSDGWPTS